MDSVGRWEDREEERPCGGQAALVSAGVKTEVIGGKPGTSNQTDE